MGRQNSFDKIKGLTFQGGKWIHRSVPQCPSPRRALSFLADMDMYNDLGVSIAISQLPSDHSILAPTALALPRDSVAAVSGHSGMRGETSARGWHVSS